MLETIAFDADDTLWHGEIYYQDAQLELQQILAPWAAPETVDHTLNEIELHNLPVYGYGVKAFVLSMIETSLQISSSKIRGTSIEKILAIGRAMLQAEVALLPHVTETLQTLSSSHHLMVITKGDILDQTAKLSRSGLEGYFALIEVVNEKTSAEYKKILDKYQLDPDTFLMVGNSLRSDIAPVLDLGCKAVHIPAYTTWEHEKIAGFDTTRDGFFTIEEIKLLPALILKLS